MVFRIKKQLCLYVEVAPIEKDLRQHGIIIPKEFVMKKLGIIFAMEEDYEKEQSEYRKIERDNS